MSSPDENMLQCVRDHFLCGFTFEETMHDMFGSHNVDVPMCKEHYTFVQAIYVFSILGLVSSGERINHGRF